MRELRARLARRWRAWCDRRATVAVLVLGDSHVRVFEHWWFMWALPQVRWRIVYVPGGTATGLYNASSATQTYARFEEALRDERPGWVVLNLGEVDTGYTIWARAERSRVPVEAMLDQAVERYTRYIGELAARCRLVVISAPLPTLPDDYLPADTQGSGRLPVAMTLRERTALTLAFNNRVAQSCRSIDVPYLDDRCDSLSTDGVVRAAWMRRDSPDHHYDRKTYARWISRTLAPLLHMATR